MDRAIIQTLPSGGTPSGVSFWRQLVYGCPRRALIAKARAAEALINTATRQKPTAGYLMIGTIYHALQELYHTRKKPWECRAVQFNSVSPGGVDEEVARLEGERLFKEYRRRHKPNAMGRVIAAEQLLPENETQRKAINAATGFPEYTCRIDLQMMIVSQAQATRIRKERGVRVKPGYWIRDWKTAGSMSEIDYERFLHDLQFLMYQVAWSAAYPKRKLQGLIVDVITKTKEIKLCAIAIPAPKAPQLKIVAAFAEQANAAWDAWGSIDPYTVPCNPDRCFDYYRRCPYMFSPCQRY